MGFVRLDWGEGYYSDTGGDDAPLLFLHGTGCDSRDWDGGVAELPEGVRAVLMDFRGHGRSDVPGGPFTLAGLADDVLARVDRLELGGGVLVGHSLGGMVALDAASRS